MQHRNGIKNLSRKQLTRGWDNPCAGLYFLGLTRDGLTLELRRHDYVDGYGQHRSSWTADAVRTQYLPAEAGNGSTEQRYRLAKGPRLTDLLMSLQPVTIAELDDRIWLLIRHVWPQSAAPLIRWEETRVALEEWEARRRQADIDAERARAARTGQRTIYCDPNDPFGLNAA